MELEKIRHSSAHIMAAVLGEMFPEAQFGVGPMIKTGFYYDFLVPRNLVEDDLPEIEEAMKKFITERHEFKRQVVSKTEARKIFSNQKFKLEIIDQIPDGEEVSIYTVGKFVDLCRGPHVGNTKDIPSDALKLLSIAGAYWRGDEKRPMLQRIYGTAFSSADELNDFNKKRKEYEKRDHKKLGKELRIYFISDEIGKGLPIWLPAGTAIVDEIEAFAKEMEHKYGYQRVKTPHLTKGQLYYRSGHLPYYKESMFPPLRTDEGEEIYLKPMNCPHHHMIYKQFMRSYKELPLRLAEYGDNFRYEKSGELSGLLRVREMRMNDAHIYCTPEQAEEEFYSIVQLYRFYYEKFRIKDYYLRLSLHKKDNNKYSGDEDKWVDAEEFMRKVLRELKVDFVEGKGEAAFYGPKVDCQIANVYGREETVSTIQLDFVMSEKFNLSYVDRDGSEKRPYIIHRAPLGTHERMISFLIELYGGAFPTWLSPIQVVLLPITQDCLAYTQELRKILLTKLFRVEVDDSGDSFNKKLRNAIVKKIPNLFILGQKETKESQVTWRRYSRTQQLSISVDKAIVMLEKLRADRVMDNFDDIDLPAV